MNTGIKGLVIAGGISIVGIGVYLLINRKNKRLEDKLENKEDEPFRIKTFRGVRDGKNMLL